jgi:AraC-like DNA-binding protein
MKTANLFFKEGLLVLFWFSSVSVCFAANSLKINEDNVSKSCFYYEQFSSIDSLNKAYSKNYVRLLNTREGLINDLGFVKCIVERSFIAQSFEILNKIRYRVKKEDPYIRGTYKMVLARLYFKVKKPQESIRINEEAIALLSSIPPTIDLKQANINQGFFLSNKEPSKAFRFYQDASKMERSGFLDFYVSLRTNIAFLFILQKELDQAERYCNQAASWLESKQHDSYLDHYRVYIIRASIAEARGNLQEEEQFLEKAKNLSLKYSMSDNLKSIHYAQSKNALEKGDYQKAFSMLQVVDSLNQVFPNSLISERLAVIDLRDEIVREKKEKSLIRERLELKSKQQQLLLSSLTLISLALVVISFQWVNVRKKRNLLVKQNMELAKNALSPTKVQSTEKSIDQTLIDQLEQIVITKELYTASNLTLDRLAKKLSTNRTYLSEAINAHYQVNYSSWINAIRVNAARKLLIDKSYDHFSIEGIANSVGFASISSFNSIFKRETGLSPSQFKKLSQQSINQ